MIQWLPWSADAFARATLEQKPVLLSITAAWCRACHEMDATTYADAGVARVIRDRFIPIRVDTDRRPDINERYNLGGWPTTAFLTPQGDLLGGGTFVPVERMEGTLRRVANAFVSRGDEIARKRGAGPSVSDPKIEGDPSVEDLIDIALGSYDETHGGFGVEPKFPHVAPLRLALALYHDTKDSRWRTMVERTLDAMAGGGLHDARDGGYFRYATTRDWQLPHQEKLLETNAAILSIFADALRAFDREADRGHVAELVTFITEQLRVPGGGFRGSGDAAVLYLDSNAAAASALLSASGVLNDAEIARGALASFERVVLACYRPGHGVAHFVDGETQVRGLLADQVAAIDALLAAFDITEDEPYRMMAEEIGHYMIRVLWDADGGGFRDRAGGDDDIGLLGVSRKPFTANCEAARMFAALARTSGEHDFAERAVTVLRGVARAAPAQGPDAAYYLLALRTAGS